MAEKRVFGVYSWKLAFLIGAYQIAFDFNHFVLYLLFAKTTYGCDFEKVFGMYYGIRAGALCARKLVTGPLTDACGYGVNVCLVVCVVGQISTQCVMFFGGWTDAWVVIGLQLGLGCFNVQAQTCVFKVIKLVLDREMPGEPEEQHTIINSLEAWGEGMATGFIAVATLVAYELGTHGAAFDVVQWIIFGVPLCFSTFTLVLAASIRRAELVPAAAAHLPYESINATAADALLARSVRPLFASGESAPPTLYASIADAPQKSWRYVLNGFALIFGSPVLLFSTLIYLVAFTYSYVVYVTLTLSESAAHASSGPVKTRANFCNGVITNLFLQAAVLNVVYMVGSAGYGYLLAPCPPLIFFSLVLPVAAAALGGATFFLLLDLTAFESSWVLAALSFLSFAYYLYVQNLGLAAVPNEYMGFFWSVIGVGGSALLYVPSIFTTYGTPVDLVIFIAAAMMGLVAVLSLIFASVARTSLRDLAHSPDAALYASVGSLAYDSVRPPDWATA